MSYIVCALYFQLSYVGQDCWKIPPVLVQMYGTKVQFLDLSFNCLMTLQGVEMFPNLEELVLDNNKLSDSVLVPQLPNLHILSLNKNNVSLMNNVVLVCDHFTVWIVWVHFLERVETFLFATTFKMTRSQLIPEDIFPWPHHEIDHPHSSNAEVKNVWSFVSILNTCLIVWLLHIGKKLPLQAS